MNNLSSYCGLVDARISTSEKDLPVQVQQLIPPFLFVLDGFPKEIFLFVFYGLQGRDLIKQARRRPLIVMLLFFKAKTPKG